MAVKIQQLFPPTFLNHASPSLLPLRALNEMWKCQNMLRGLVKELLDLHKLPVVCGCKHITETFTYIISTTRLMYTMLFSASAVWGQQHGHVWEANEYCQWVKALSSISPHASWCVLIFLWKFSACQDSLFDCLYVHREPARCWKGTGLHEEIQPSSWWGREAPCAAGDAHQPDLLLQTGRDLCGELPSSAVSIFNLVSSVSWKKS